MTGKLNGYLDHLRENLEILDEQIANARKMSTPGRKGADKAAALQWAKTLRDLVELRNATLLNIKTHLLGRDETGAPNEPRSLWHSNDEVEFERHFRSMLSPWTVQDLKLTCVDCNKHSEDVSTRHFSIPREYYDDDEYYDLCTKCYEKRLAKAAASSESDNESEGSDSSEEDSEETDENQDAINLPAEQPEGPNASTGLTMTDLVQTTVRAVALQACPPAEKVKTLEQFKNHLVRTAFSSASGQNIDPACALLDKEIERLQREAEAGKGQDAAGKPAT